MSWSRGGTHRKGASRILHTSHHYNPQITSAEIYTGLTAVGFEHIERATRLSAGENTRIPAIGKGLSNRSASVRLSDDGVAFFWYDWPSGSHGTIFADSPPITDTAEIARRLRTENERRKRRKVETAKRQRQAALLASQMWANGNSSGDHLYVDKKQLSGLHNARLDAVTRDLLILMWVSGVGLVNLQRIDAEGKKRFLQGGRTKGAYSVIGSLNNAESVIVATGWATAATLREATGMPVVVTFSDGNLMAVCQSLRSRFNDIAVVVAGDDDRQNIINTGHQKAENAARAIGGTYALPELCKCCNCTDFNDAAVCARRCGRA